MRLLAAAIALALAGCGGGDESAAVIFQQDGRVLEIRAEVAATPAQRQTGLMRRTHLAPKTGMLFVYPAPAVLRFWMKNTLIPLDIAFIHGDRVIDVGAMSPCRTDPCPITSSTGPVDRALEVPAGTYRAAGIRAGAAVSFRGAIPKAR